MMFGEKYLKHAEGGDGLARPEDKHPFDEFGFGFGDFGLQCGLHLRQPFLKAFLGDLENSLLGGLFNHVENVGQGARSIVGQTVGNNFRECDHSRVVLLRCFLKFLLLAEYNIMLDCMSRWDSYFEEG